MYTCIDNHVISLGHLSLQKARDMDNLTVLRGSGPVKRGPGTSG